MSSWAANFFGPKTFNLFSINVSTIPLERGTSGPIIVRSIFSFFANKTN